MIEDLLDLTRARQAGGIPVVPVDTDVAQLAARALDEHRAARASGRLALESQGDTTGTWDPERLVQVLSNLLGNALQHGRPEEPVGVRIDGREADHVSIVVENGGEIPAALVPSLFDPFRGSRPENGRKAGLGLGLYIVREIVRAHGGEVTAASAHGATTFRVTLPRVPKATPEAG